MESERYTQGWLKLSIISITSGYGLYNHPIRNTTPYSPVPNLMPQRPPRKSARKVVDGLHGLQAQLSRQECKMVTRKDLAYGSHVPRKIDTIVLLHTPRGQECSIKGHTDTTAETQVHAQSLNLHRMGLHAVHIKQHFPQADSINPLNSIEQAFPYEAFAFQTVLNGRVFANGICDPYSYSGRAMRRRLANKSVQASYMSINERTSSRVDRRAC